MNEGWDKEALVEQAEMEQVQMKIIKNAALVGDPRFLVAMHILANTVTGNKVVESSKIYNALAIADDFIEAYNDV